MKGATQAQVKQALDIGDDDPGVLTLAGGMFTLRRGYYWRPKHTPFVFFSNTVDKLKLSFDVEVLDYGDKYAPFRGGEGVKRNSHYYMVFRAKTKAA